MAAACGAGGSIDVAAETTAATAATGPTTSTEPAPAVRPTGPGPALEPPPDVTVRSAEVVVELQPWTYCYGNGCADGTPPADPPDVGSTDEVTVEYPLPGWSFTATFEPTGAPCPRQQSVPLTANGDGTFTLTPAGRAGTYDVTLAGQGDGDLYVSFRWTTARDGPLARPEARLALIADHDGRPDSYGVELMLSNLAATPVEASATIAVRSRDGNALRFPATRAPGCMAEGTVYWDGPDDKGLEAAALGEAPFTYDVEVVLDGARHTATATWPDDEIAGNEPSVALEFSPPLPALG